MGSSDSQRVKQPPPHCSQRLQDWHLSAGYERAKCLNLFTMSAESISSIEEGLIPQQSSKLAPLYEGRVEKNRMAQKV